MGTVAQILTLLYTMEVLDKNHTGLISVQQLVDHDIKLGNIPQPAPGSLLDATDVEAMSSALVKELGGTNDSLSIDKQLRPALIKAHENHTTFNLRKCNQLECPASVITLDLIPLFLSFIIAVTI